MHVFSLASGNIIPPHLRFRERIKGEGAFEKEILDNLVRYFSRIPNTKRMGATY